MNTNQKLFVAGVLVVGLSILFAPILLQKYKVSECVSTVQNAEAVQYGGNYKTDEVGIRVYCLKLMNGALGN